MDHLDDRRALGARLKGARKLAGFTLESASKAMTERGYKIGKAGLGHWETGTNVPDAFALRRLAKLYGTTVDALVTEDTVSMEAIRFAAQYDNLDERQKRAFRAMWLAYFEQASTDARVEQHLPLPPGAPSEHTVHEPAAAPYPRKPA